MKELITIFTPTYNRKKLLNRVYQSLMAQTNKNFIWMIIDDGSTDGTKELVEKMTVDSSFKIFYYYQINGGKHRAHNNAISKCKTEFILILDSDDWLSNDAIEILLEKAGEIRNKENICGIIGNRYDPINKVIIGRRMPNVKFASGNELYQKYGLCGDTLRMYKTDILKLFLFPEIENEKFLSENVVFDQIDNSYRMLVIKEILYFCEYQVEGYSNNIYSIHKQNPKGYALSLKSSYESAVTIKKKISYMLLYIIWCKEMKVKVEKIQLGDKILQTALLPISFVFRKIKYPSFFFKHFS